MYKTPHPTNKQATSTNQWTNEDEKQQQTETDPVHTIETYIYGTNLTLFSQTPATQFISILCSLPSVEEGQCSMALEGMSQSGARTVPVRVGD